MFDTLPALQGIALIEAVASVLCWVGLGLFFYCCYTLWKNIFGS